MKDYHQENINFITEDEEKYLKSMIEEWQNLIEIVEKIKGGE